MTVRVSNHALQRFRERSEVAREDFQIVRFLTGIVLLASAPWKSEAWRLRNRNIVLVGVTNGETATVKSCWFV